MIKPSLSLLRRVVILAVLVNGAAQADEKKSTGQMSAVSSCESIQSSAAQVSKADPVESGNPEKTSPPTTKAQSAE